MAFFLQWLALASIQLAATMSPGPAFAMTVRNAVSCDRLSGILTAIGLGLGVGAHVLFVIFGISLLVAQSPVLYAAIKYAGAAYLIFIGAKSLLARSPDKDTYQPVQKKIKNLAPWRRVQNGLFTNILNPKAFIFFTAVYAQFINPQTPPSILTLYGVTSIIIEIGWFSIVTIFLTAPKIRAAFSRITHWIERVSGGLLIGLGVKLAISKL